MSRANPDLKVRIAGFEPFGSLTVNHSMIVVTELEKRFRLRTDCAVSSAVLPTAYESAAQRVGQIVIEDSPQLLILMGVDRQELGIAFERFALNVSDDSSPDNDGETRLGSRVVEGAPDAYRTTLSIEQLLRWSRARGMPTRISNFAGTFVCNHAYFASLHAAAQTASRMQCGLIHFPAESPTQPAHNRPSLSQVIDAMASIVGEAIRLALTDRQLR